MSLEKLSESFKKRELVNIFTKLNELKEIQSTKFAYMIKRNLNLLEPIVRPLFDERAWSAEFNEYAKQAREIHDRHKIDTEEYKQFMSVLENKYEQVIAEQEEKNRKFHIDCEEEVDISLFKVHFESLPPNLNAIQLQLLEPVIFPQA